MSTEQPGHGLDEYLAKINAIPKEVRVNARVENTDNDADFDRRVRKSLDRQHRRNVIAQG